MTPRTRRYPAVALAMLMIFVVLATVDRALAAVQPHEHLPLAGHNEAPPTGEHGHGDAPCHGVLLCHVGVAANIADPGRAVPIDGGSRWRGTYLLPHLTHPAFDPPPPRIQV